MFRHKSLEQVILDLNIKIDSKLGCLKQDVLLFGTVFCNCDRKIGGLGQNEGTFEVVRRASKNFVLTLAHLFSIY